MFVVLLMQFFFLLIVVNLFMSKKNQLKRKQDLPPSQSPTRTQCCQRTMTWNQRQLWKTCPNSFSTQKLPPLPQSPALPPETNMTLYLNSVQLKLIKTLNLTACHLLGLPLSGSTSHQRQMDCKANPTMFFFSTRYGKGTDTFMTRFFYQGD